MPDRRCSAITHHPESRWRAELGIDVGRFRSWQQLEARSSGRGEAELAREQADGIAVVADDLVHRVAHELAAAGPGDDGPPRMSRGTSRSYAATARAWSDGLSLDGCRRPCAPAAMSSARSGPTGWVRLVQGGGQWLEGWFDEIEDALTEGDPR